MSLLPPSPSLPILSAPAYSYVSFALMGMLGGKETLYVMATTRMYRHKWLWMGQWYNSPGLLQLARHFYLAGPRMHRLLASREVQLFDLAELFELRGKGPKFTAAHSGSVIQETGYLAALFVKNLVFQDSKGSVAEKYGTVTVIIADLGKVPDSDEMRPTHPSRFRSLSTILPIIASAAACAGSLVLGDPFAGFTIFMGAVANGISSLLIGSADLVFTNPKPHEGYSPGDGIFASDKMLIVLKGAEGAINLITHGQVSFRFSRPRYRIIGKLLPPLLFAAFFTQLLFIAQATQFGQLLYFASLLASFGYNKWMSNVVKERMQWDLLFKNALGLELKNYVIRSRIRAAIFSLFAIHGTNDVLSRTLLDELFPNDTQVWHHFKDTVSERFPSITSFPFTEEDWELPGFNEEERRLLKDLYAESMTGYETYLEYYPLPPPSSPTAYPPPLHPLHPSPSLTANGRLGDDDSHSVTASLMRG